MSGSILLDTNIIINILKNNNLTIQKVATYHKIYFPVIAIAELIYGAYNAQNTEKKLAEVEKIKTKGITLYLDDATTYEYGKIKSKLKQNGTPIPENDIWIAAIAQQHQLPIFTNDKHFKQVENLELISLINH